MLRSNILRGACLCRHSRLSESSFRSEVRVEVVSIVGRLRVGDGLTEVWETVGNEFMFHLESALLKYMLICMRLYARFWQSDDARKLTIECYHDE